MPDGSILYVLRVAVNVQSPIPGTQERLGRLEDRQLTTSLVLHPTPTRFLFREAVTQAWDSIAL